MTTDPAVPRSLRTVALLLAVAGSLAACSSPGATTPVAPPAASSATPVLSPTSAGATPSPSSSGPSPSAASASPKPSDAGYTMAVVRKHDGASSCWSVVDGTVYDLTRWVGRHPGGRQRILSMCGRDGSRLFHGEHGKESRPARILAGYELGPLG